MSHQLVKNVVYKATLKLSLKKMTVVTDFPKYACPGPQI
jgi:hypothetical protein